jgi:hypothetical protein
VHLEFVIAAATAALVAWTLIRRDQPGRHARSGWSPVRTGGYGLTAEGLAGLPIGPDDDEEFLASLEIPRRPEV